MLKYTFLLFFSLSLFGQNTTVLESKIYNELDTFVAKPSVQGLKKLETEEKNFHPQTQSEIVAFFTFEYNLGYYQNQFGNIKKAISSYENAWRLYQKNKLFKYEIVDSCLIPLGNLYSVIGDFVNAENIVKQYFYIANSKKNNPDSSRQKYVAILTLSNIYQNTGKIDQAIDLLDKTIKFEKLTNSQKGTLLGNLGANYLVRHQSLITEQNDFENANKSLMSSIALLQLDKTHAENLSNAYRNLSKLNLPINIEKASNYFEKAKIEFAKCENIEPRKIAQFYLEEATILYKKEQFNEVKNLISKLFQILIPNFSNGKNGLPDKKSLYAENTLLDALDLQADLFLTQNQPKKALESYQLAFYIEELFQSLLVYEDSKIVIQLRNRYRTEKCIDIYSNLYRKEKKSSYLEAAFLLSESTKSVVLKDYISNSKTISREEKLIRQQLQDWKNSILKEQQKGDYADINKINEAIKKQNELMLLLKTKFSDKATSSQKLNLNNLYFKLEKDKAILVEYFFGNHRMYIFTLENRVVKLDSFSTEDTTIPKIVNFIDYFSDGEKIVNNVSEYNHYGFLLYEMLKLPKKSTNKNLEIIPDGILTFFPFEALITKESNTTNFAKMHYLLKDFIIGYNNSALFYLNEIPFKHEKETVLGVFPIFENSNLELSFSKKEMKAIQKKFEGKYLSNNDATFENFLKNASNFSIVHLSTHANSGDIFDPASIKFYDREVLYSELYNLDINPNLVVLSACETGIGKLYKAEGAMSVARGFQFAGAQNLLFSLWKVNDFTTSVLMTNFYNNINSGLPYFQSINKAKIDFLKDRSIPNAKKSPYYWSAFVYYGTLNTKPVNNYFLWFSIIGGVIGLFLLFKIFKKWRKSKRH